MLINTTWLDLTWLVACRWRSRRGWSDCVTIIDNWRWRRLVATASLIWLSGGRSVSRLSSAPHSSNTSLCRRISPAISDVPLNVAPSRSSDASSPSTVRPHACHDQSCLCVDKSSAFRRKFAETVTFNWLTASHAEKRAEFNGKVQVWKSIEMTEIEISTFDQTVKPSFVIFDIRALWRTAPWASECPGVKNDGLTRSGTRCFIAVYPFGNSGRQRVNNVDEKVCLQYTRRVLR